MGNGSIWPIDGALSGAPIPGQSGPASDGNEMVLPIPQSSITPGASSSDCFVSYPERSLGWGSYSSAKVLSVYSIAPAERASSGGVLVSSVDLQTYTSGFESQFIWPCATSKQKAK